MVTAPPVAPRAFTKDKAGAEGSSTHSKWLFPVALFLAIALIGMGLWRSSTQKSVVAESMQVVAAGKDIHPGVRIGFTSLHYMNIPRKYYSEHMYQSYEQLAGQVSQTFIPMGEPIVKGYLFPPGQEIALSLAADERAICLNLSDDALVDHAISPGDRVDVLATISSNGKKYTKTLCQSVRVLMCTPKEALSTGRTGEQERNKVTLAVAASDGERIALAAETGKVRLVLRNRLRCQSSDYLPGADQNDLMPASARKEGALAVQSSRPATPRVLPPPPPLLPVPAGAALPAPGEPLKTDPVGWVVEMFAGNHRDRYEVPQR